MAFAAGGPGLAAAVANAGGIGAVGAGLTPAEPLRQIIRAVRSLAGERPFHVNLLTFFGDEEQVDEEQVEVCAEERVPIVSFHWGHPAAHHLAMLREAGVSVSEQVGSAEAARRAVDEGVEVVVAQGWEAGGHNYGGLPTFVLVPTIVDAVGDSVTASTRPDTPCSAAGPRRCTSSIRCRRRPTPPAAGRRCPGGWGRAWASSTMSARPPTSSKP
jgi:enoyl-[acyl-carrier protein] reductase II